MIVYSLGDSGVLERVDSFVNNYEENDLMGLRDLLYRIAETIGEIGSKYSPQRIQVRVVHGTDYTCEKKACEICQLST